MQTCFKIKKYMESHFPQYGTIVSMTQVNKLSVPDVSESQNKRPPHDHR